MPYLIEQTEHRNSSDPFASFSLLDHNDANDWFVHVYLDNTQYSSTVYSVEDLFEVFADHYLTSHLSTDELQRAADDFWSNM